MLLGVGAKKKTYADEVFSTYLYTGNATARSINTGVDMTEGGLVWLKTRSNARANTLFDTVRGANKYLLADHNHAETTNLTDMLTGFNNNGFSLGVDASSDNVNRNDYTQASWSFRKSPGFFTICQWSGNATAGREISHDLGSVPGMILVKETTGTQQWYVYHKDTGPSKYLVLNGGGSAISGADFTNGVTPTSTAFTLSSDAAVNGSSKDYIAYVFAGGESTAATARSVDFDSTWPGDDLKIASSADFQYGTGDFTWEAYVKPTDLSTSNRYILNHRTASGGGGGIYIHQSNQCLAYENASGSGDTILANRKIYKGQWTHVAVSRNSNVTRLFQDGILVGTGTHDDYSFPESYFHVGINSSASGNGFHGNISNVRLIKGTGLYTSSFRPPTEPLTNVTNTKLLCCNNSSVTGSTVTPGTITSEGNTPTASTDSPFDDPAAFTFGDSKEGIVKCGSYIGNNSTAEGPEIFLGWEPTYLLMKESSGLGDWTILDSMRGINDDGGDNYVHPNLTDAETTGNQRVDLTSTGFKLRGSSNFLNEDGATYIYMAIRRNDGYVGKPAEAGTGVFAMDTGAGSSTIPNFDSGFPVDFALNRPVASVQIWFTTARLMSGQYLRTNDTDAEAGYSTFTFDSNVGWSKSNDLSTYQSWMWKRHAGFDVVTYAGVPSTYSATGVGSIAVPHSLNAVPEMMWVKNRTYGDNNGWAVYHKGLNGGTNPEQYRIRLQDTNAEDDNVGMWQDTAPTSTHFTLGTDRTVNQDTFNYVAMLFASVDGISKVGYYTGSGSTGFSVTTGFSPRYIIIKRTDSADYWAVFDTVRGLASGNDPMLKLDSSAAQITGYDIIDPTSTGFDIVSTDGALNGSNGKYIYYAHA